MGLSLFPTGWFLFYKKINTQIWKVARDLWGHFPRNVLFVPIDKAMIIPTHRGSNNAELLSMCCRNRVY